MGCKESSFLLKIKLYYKKSLQFRFVPKLQTLFLKAVFYRFHLQRLIAENPFYCLEISIAELTELPEYVRPTGFIVMDKIPLTSVGKVNYRVIGMKTQ